VAYCAYDACCEGLIVNRVTSLRVARETRNRLLELRSKDETFDQIIRRLIDFYKSNSEVS